MREREYSTQLSHAVNSAVLAEMERGADGPRDVFLSLAEKHGIQPDEWSLLLFGLFDVIHFRSQRLQRAF
jgi:hypothetical protein